MNFVVRWTQTALNELTTCWTDASDRAAVTRAAHEIERLLAGVASSCGEPRRGIERTVALRPLWVLFEVDVTTRTATIQQVRLLPTAPPSD